ncbi:hypothetical protein N7492_002507 [Penicillium capsulatum]|uniref:Aminoglycoside phosphotransferase domain-containing protein n=1 Tax=Penicillium capsulatum TaxID=69766 RepID=A0A9W9IK69_9EURO|nr:hypothetical protein N7492_002507 [Penicillium capsulatum]KAJ6122889.1 hypothetical protein N7512_005354 [Penicillium capsulatum]
MQLCMSYDDVAWDQSDDFADNWLRQFLDIKVLTEIAHYVLKHDSGDDPEFSILRKGFYNITLRVKYKHGTSTNIRFTQPGTSLFPEEKFKNEVAVMRYILDQTSIPVPFVHDSGSREDSPL